MSYVCLSFSICLPLPPRSLQSLEERAVARGTFMDLHRPSPLIPPHLSGIHPRRPHISCSSAFLLKPIGVQPGTQESSLLCSLGKVKPPLVTTRCRVPGINLSCLTFSIYKMGPSSCCKAAVNCELVPIYECLEWCLAPRRCHSPFPLAC